MRRQVWLRAAGAGLAGALLVSCSQGGHETKPPARTSQPAPHKSTPPPTQAQVESHRQQLLTQFAKGANAPDSEGLTVAGPGTQKIVFFWSTADRRYCVATFASSGLSTSRCRSGVPMGRTPQLHRLYEGDSFSTHGGYGLIVAADRETILSATCGGAPVPLRKIRVSAMGGAERTVYVMDFDGWTGGVLKTKVLREDGGRTVDLPLGVSHERVPRSDSWHSCGDGSASE
ncbi:hypothetical protein ACFC0D_03880 [Streptomyces sp. NPDC056222]|uniref:hypothetical protein n=1 Tax=Streptomyces sp. NPDC056222 TaxID=3345749 RepID=UPI0035DEEDD1